MSRFHRAAAVVAVLAASAPAVFAQKQIEQPDRTAAEISFTYTALRANASVGDCGCFWTEGGSAELAVPIWRLLSGVAEISGQHADHLPASDNVGLSLISGMGGLRLSRPVYRRYVPFGQGLVGAVHAFDSSFPHSTFTRSYATSFAMAAGIGLDVAISKHILLRPVQAEYQYMELPNNSTDEQHDIRLSAGVVFRFVR